MSRATKFKHHSVWADALSLFKNWIFFCLVIYYFFFFSPLFHLNSPSPGWDDTGKTNAESRIYLFIFFSFFLAWVWLHIPKLCHMFKGHRFPDSICSYATHTQCFGRNSLRRHHFISELWLLVLLFLLPVRMQVSGKKNNKIWNEKICIMTFHSGCAAFMRNGQH